MSLPVESILTHLNLPLQPPPTAATLDALLAAWAARIPWESASRIAYHQDAGTPDDYARPPERFFADALRLGTGGTCFESNLALRALLDALGFEVTLHFCDMRSATVTPHCATVVPLVGALDLAAVGDAGATALRLGPAAPLQRGPPARPTRC